jgi:hypothetical protein
VFEEDALYASPKSPASTPSSFLLPPSPGSLLFVAKTVFQATNRSVKRGPAASVILGVGGKQGLYPIRYGQLCMARAAEDSLKFGQLEGCILVSKHFNTLLLPMKTFKTAAIVKHFY